MTMALLTDILVFFEPQAKEIQMSEPSTHEEDQGRSGQEEFVPKSYYYLCRIKCLISNSNEFS